MSDLFTEFFDASPLGCPGWEHSRAWHRGADTLGGTAQIVAIRLRGGTLVETIECPLPAGAMPDPTRIVQAIHDRIAAIERVSVPTAATGATEVAGQPVPILPFLWSLFEKVP